MPSVSVVIPTKDRCEYLKEVLPSYLSQQEVAEVVIVNDGSTDATLDFLQREATADSRVRWINNPVNIGVPAAKNIGIAAATSELVFLGEDDLELTSGFFATLIDHMRATGADLICSRVVWRRYGEDASTALARVDSLARDSYVDKRAMRHTSGLSTGEDSQQLMSDNPALGRAELFRLFPFDEQYKVNFWREETDFQFRLQEAGFGLFVCPHTVCFNYIIDRDRGGVHSVVGLTRVMWIVINNWRFVRKHRTFIAENFDIGNPYAYLARFTVRKVAEEVVMPAVVGLKRWALSSKSPW